MLAPVNFHVAFMDIVSLRSIRNFELLSVPGLVPSPDAKYNSVEVEADPDKAEEADDSVADEKHMIRSLSFVAALERGVDDNVDGDWDEDMRSP